MQRVYNRKAPKQATNLSINSDLLKAAREAGVNLSSVLEEALAQKVANAKLDAWKRDNADAIERTMSSSMSRVFTPMEAGASDRAVFGS